MCLTCTGSSRCSKFGRQAKSFRHSSGRIGGTECPRFFGLLLGTVVRSPFRVLRRDHAPTLLSPESMLAVSASFKAGRNECHPSVCVLGGGVAHQGRIPVGTKAARWPSAWPPPRSSDRQCSLECPVRTGKSRSNLAFPTSQVPGQGGSTLVVVGVSFIMREMLQSRYDRQRVAVRLVAASHTTAARRRIATIGGGERALTWQVHLKWLLFACGSA